MIIPVNNFEHALCRAAANYIRSLFLIAMGFGFCEVSMAEISAVSPMEKPAKVAAQGTTTKPLWSDLNPAQQSVLAPLSHDWETLDTVNKNKWLVIARRYPAMPARDQQRAQERMREWVRLSPEQRRVARDSYARIQALPPEKRAALLKTYQALPDEKKKQLADENRKKIQLVPRRPVKKTAPSQAKALPPSPESPPPAQ